MRKGKVCQCDICKQCREIKALVKKPRPIGQGNN